MESPTFERDTNSEDPASLERSRKISVEVHKPDIISRSVEKFWSIVEGFLKTHKKLVSVTSLVTLAVLVVAYFITAVLYYTRNRCTSEVSCSLEWCHGHGFLIILMVLTCTGLFYFHILKRFFGRVLYKNVLQHISTSFDKIWQKRLVRIALYLILPGTLIAFLVWDTSNDRERLKSLMGLIVFMLFGFLFSKHPGKIQWRPVVWGLVLQFLFGLISIRWTIGRQIFQCIGDKFTTFLSYTDAGTNFMYGNLISAQGTFAFKVLPVIFFFSLVVQVLYYWGTMQWIVLKLGWLLQVSMGTTVCESVNAAASIFLGLSEAPLLIKPYISNLTKSELHAVMCAGFSTVAGTVLAAYISFGVKASHVITASIMSAPAALCYAKLFYPETEKSQTRVENMTLKKGDERGLLDAATKGAMAGTALVLGITANIIAFVTAVEFLDGIISWLAHLVGSHEIDFKKLLSLLFIPVVWLMGVHPEECENVAELVGLKTIVNEFVAYQRLGDMKKNGTLSGRSEVIATYALCGFSNPGSIGIIIASLSTMAPHRRSDITQVAVRAFIAGCAVCFLTACIAGTVLYYAAVQTMTISRAEKTQPQTPLNTALPRTIYGPGSATVC